MSIFFSFITGATIVIISSFCTSYIEFKRQQKEQHIEIKKEIYVDFREMYYLTRNTIMEGKYDDLQNISDESTKSNASLIARAEIYLPESIVDKMREFVESLIALYAPINDLNELKDKCNKVDSMADELLLIIKNDLNIR